jgi:hypothetical protein
VSIPCGACHECLDMVQTPYQKVLRHMILCPKCGNKRCPKATDCSYACTNSNEVGQPGSIYRAAPSEGPARE